MLYDNGMENKTFDTYFAEWKVAINTDPHTVDFTTTVNSIPADPDKACRALSQMIEELFEASKHQLLFSELSVVAEKMHTSSSNAVVHKNIEGYTRLCETVLVISHYYKDSENTKMTQMEEYISQLQDTKLKGGVQFLSKTNITLQRHEWYRYVSENLMGPHWAHISGLYGIDYMKTVDLACLMNSIHPILLQRHQSKINTTEIAMPNDLSL